METGHSVFVDSSAFNHGSTTSSSTTTTGSTTTRKGSNYPFLFECAGCVRVS